MATDVLFPIYDILVNLIFGSIGLSLVAVYVILVLILALCRTSWVFILFWSLFYISVMLTFYLGGVGLVIVFILSMLYLGIQIYKFVQPDR